MTIGSGHELTRQSTSPDNVARTMIAGIGENLAPTLLNGIDSNVEPREPGILLHNDLSPPADSTDSNFLKDHVECSFLCIAPFDMRMVGIQF